MNGKFSVLRVFHQIIEPLRDIAGECGYALTVHGSLARDIDLVAIPWVANLLGGADLATPTELVEKIRIKLEELRGYAEYDKRWPQPEVKPHGRLGWGIQIGGTYVDISVMPLGDLHTYIEASFAQSDEWRKTHGGKSIGQE